MNPESIITHPDSHLLITVSHNGVQKILADLKDGDHNDELIVAVDRGDKYSKIYVLAREDI